MDFLQGIDPLTLMGSILVFIAIGYYIWTEKKKLDESGLPIGEYITGVLLQGHVLWILIALIGICAAEAVFAASIHTGTAVNPIARFFAHGSTAFGGMVMNILFAERVAEFLAAFGFLFDAKKINDPRRYILLFTEIVGLAIVGFAALYVPYLLYVTIASGLGELQNAEWAFWELPIWHFFGVDLRQEYVNAGFPVNYRPLEHLSYPMFASYGMMLVHYIFAGYDGWHAVRSRYKAELDGVPATRKNDSFQEDVRNYASNPSEGIRYLVTMAGNSRDKGNIQDIVRDIVLQYQKQRPPIKAKIATNLAKQVQRWKSYEAETRGKDNPTKRKALTDDTHALFRKSMSAGGLERALSNRRQP